MIKRAIALLMLLVMLPLVAFATAPVAKGLDQAMALLERVFTTEDVALQRSLILQAAEAAPDSPEILLDCAQLLYYLDQTGEYAPRVEEMLRTALPLAQGDLKAVVVQTLAEQLTVQGRLAEAVEIVEAASAENPTHEGLRTVLATVLFYADRREEALSMLTELIDDSPENMEARRLYATILLDEARFDEALQAYRQIEAEWPEYLDGVYGQYLTYIASGDFEMGLRAIDILIGGGGDEALWVERARIRLWKQYRPEEALADTEPLLRKDPTWTDAAVVKVVSLIMLERYDEALEAADQVVAQDANFGGLLRAIVLMNATRWDDAEAELTALAERAPTGYAFWKNLATVRLDGFDDADGAMAHMAKAFVAAGGAGDMDMYIQLGQVYRRMGMREEAARAFAMANQLTYEDAAPLYYQTMVCLEAGQGELAQQALQEMERRYPGWYETMLARVIYDDVVGDSQAAVDAYAPFSEKFPYPASSMGRTEALLMAASGDEEGVQRLAEAAKSEDAGAADWDSYAFAQVLIGDLEGAEASMAQMHAHVAAELETAWPGDARNLQISQWTTEAMLLAAQGDMEGAAKLLGQAMDLGWPPRELLLNEKHDTLTQCDAYAALLAQAAGDAQAWDLTVEPKIPEM